MARALRRENLPKGRRPEKVVGQIEIHPIQEIEHLGPQLDRAIAPKPDETHHRKIDIAFVGVWDTVDAYGLPVDEPEPEVLAYLRTRGDRRFLVALNFGSTSRRAPLPEGASGRVVVSTHHDREGRRVAYTIVAGDALEPPDGQELTVAGVPIRALRAAGNAGSSTKSVRCTRGIRRGWTMVRTCGSR